jgi:hypothetical protein
MNINDGGNQMSDYAKSPLLALPSATAASLSVTFTLLFNRRNDRQFTLVTLLYVT